MAHRFMRLLGALALVVAVSAAPLATVSACSCMQLGPGDAFANADVAFVGVVARVDAPAAGPIVSSADPIFYTFAVEESLKGDLGNQLVVSSTQADGASCGMAFGVGERWRMYAHADGEGGLNTSTCSGNELMETGVPIPEIAAPEAGPPPTAVIVAGVAALALIGISAWAFTRPARKADQGPSGS